MEYQGIHLFRLCQQVASEYVVRNPDQLLLPSGARIFYYVRLVLLRQGWEPAVAPTEAPVSPMIAEAFLQQMPRVAAYLAAEFGHVVHLLADPFQVAPPLLAGYASSHTSELSSLLSSLSGPDRLPHQDILALWETALRRLQERSFPALALLVNHQNLLVAPIARPQDREKTALCYLRERLVRDNLERSWRIPPTELYLYDEPLLSWFVRGLLSQPWFRVFWQQQLTQTRPLSSS